NQADSVAYNLEKLVKDNREKLGEDEAGRVEEALAEARKAAEGEDAAAIRAAVERMNGASRKLAETLYKQSAPPSGERAASDAGPKDDVVDAEYTVKN